MAKSKSPPYQVHPGVGMVRKWVDALPEKTGKTLEEWSDIIQRAKLPDAKSRQAWLTKVHGFGGNESYWMAEYSQGKHTWDFDPNVYLKQAVQFVDDQFAGPKAALRPIFEVVLDFARTLGSDVRVCPCKTIVPIYRNRVFAELKPATKTRLELALALGESPFDPPFTVNPRAKGNDRLRHLIPLFHMNDFNAAAKKALKTAYKLDEGKSRSLRA